MPYKDIEKRREAGRKSARKHRDKRRAYYQEYISDPKNRQKKAAYMAEYEADPEKKAAKIARNQLSYQKNKERVRIRQANRRKERLGFMHRVALAYGCQNPDCKWNGEFQPHQLDFHHLDPSTKLKEVAKMESFSFDKIIEEINKCVVVCKNCHADVHHGDARVDESMLCKITSLDIRG